MTLWCLFACNCINSECSLTPVQLSRLPVILLDTKSESERSWSREDGWRCLWKWCIITLWCCSPSLEGVSSVSSSMDIQDVCVRVKCWCCVEAVGVGGLGGVIITRCSHQCNSPFPFKRALCSSFSSFSSLSTSACFPWFSEFHLSDLPPLLFLYPCNVPVLSYMLLCPNNRLHLFFPLF